MNRELVLIHGRAQEQKDATALKGEWLSALSTGLEANGLSMAVPPEQTHFPYYGDALFDLAHGKPVGQAAEVILRGTQTDDQARQFVRKVLEEVQRQRGISDDEIRDVLDSDVIERGPQNWEWVQAVLRVIDRHIPGGSSNSIALVTSDVYQYLKNSTIRQRIEDGIVKAITPGVETVVVAHSLGTVVAYNLLRREGHLRNWKVPLLVTVGSPLAITEIRKVLRANQPIRCPECVLSWSNARDPVDVVALYPLDVRNFPLEPLEPALLNKSDVANTTSNHHGIAGYLSDAKVARWIYEALTR